MFTAVKSETVSTANLETPSFQAEDTWFQADPHPRFTVDFDGRVHDLNPSGHATLESGLLTRTEAGALKFGSSESDACFHKALRQLQMRREGTARLVLRRRDSAWFAATLHKVGGRPLAILALRSDTMMSKDALAAIVDAFHLSRSEGEVLHGLLDGACAKTVANELSISEHTVRSHLRSIYAKLGVKGLSHAIRLSCHLTM